MPELRHVYLAPIFHPLLSSRESRRDMLPFYLIDGLVTRLGETALIVTGPVKVSSKVIRNIVHKFDFFR
jgi:hypothetical protein